MSSDILTGAHAAQCKWTKLLSQIRNVIDHDKIKFSIIELRDMILFHLSAYFNILSLLHIIINFCLNLLQLIFNGLLPFI